MAHDPKLVELMAEAYWKTAGDGIQWDTAKQGDTAKQVAHELIGKRHSSGMPRLGKTRADKVREGMRAVLDAIKASGTHWVAPWEITKAVDHDPKLVELLAAAIYDYADEPSQDSARNVLAAINASGYWVAPWEITKAMQWHAEAWRWAQLRDSYLAERRGDTE